MEPREIGSMLHHPAAGNQIATCVQSFPYLQARPGESDPDQAVPHAHACCKAGRAQADVSLLLPSKHVNHVA